MDVTGKEARIVDGIGGCKSNDQRSVEGQVWELPLQQKDLHTNKIFETSVRTAKIADRTLSFRQLIR